MVPSMRKRIITRRNFSIPFQEFALDADIPLHAAVPAATVFPLLMWCLFFVLV